MSEDSEQTNFELFRDCISTTIIERCSTTVAVKPQKRRNARKTAGKGPNPSLKEIPTTNAGGNDAEELAEFIDYLALEVFTCLPPELRTLAYNTYSHSTDLQDRYAPPLTQSTVDSILQNIDPSTIDSLTVYGLLPPPSSVTTFLQPVLNNYVTTLTTAPPAPSQTKALASGCEICDRDWVPLTYHHLIPRFVHAKVIKRGWHTEDDLNNVAWLCRACHSFVHRMASHEVLARQFYTVELLLEREDVQKFAQWVSKVRFKAR